MEPQNFTRYRERGAYHWGVFDRRTIKGLRAFDPRLAARYDIVCRFLQREGILGEVGLDAGCGDGAGLYTIHLAGGRCIGIDGDATAIELAREYGAKHGVALEVQQGSLTRLPFEDHAFGYVMLLDVIEHLENAVEIVLELRRVVRPGGYVLITTPMELAPGTVQDRFHVREYTIESLRALLAPHFAMVNVEGYVPRVLLNLHKSSRIDLVRRSGLWTVKLAAAAGVNCFSRFTGTSSGRFADVFAVCRV